MHSEIREAISLAATTAIQHGSPDVAVCLLDIMIPAPKPPTPEEETDAPLAIPKKIIGGKLMPNGEQSFGHVLSGLRTEFGTGKFTVDTAYKLLNGAKGLGPGTAKQKRTRLCNALSAAFRRGQVDRFGRGTYRFKR